MHIINCGRGVHKREVRGVDRLRDLPNDWYAFTNLDLATGSGRSREIDVVVIAEDRIFVIDLKDWDGSVESRDGRWLHNGRDTGPSPVQKVHQNAKDILHLLEANLRRHGKGAPPPTPKIHGIVVITGNADTASLADTEVLSVYQLGLFFKAASDTRSRVREFGGVNPAILAAPLTSTEWKGRLGSFFNARTGKLVPGRRRYGNFVACSDAATFEHPRNVYAEYEAEDENASRTLGTLRTWDFTKLDGRFQTEEGRAEIAGREQAVVSYLIDRGDTIEAAILEPRAYDHDKGIDFWEVFERRRRLKRLSDFVASERSHLPREARLELARQVLAKVASLHEIGASHLDLGGHSIWLEAPSTVRLSHLMAARFPQVASLGEDRYRVLSSLLTPEDVLGGEGDARRRDVFLLGTVLHHLLLDRPPSPTDPSSGIPEWSPGADPTLNFADLHTWFDQALSLAPSERFADAGEALRAFSAAIATRPSPAEVAAGLDGFRVGLRTQKQLLGAYPEKATVREDDRVDAWRSDVGEGGSLVKVWKRPSWGDQHREAPRILDFLRRARDVSLDPPPGCATVRDALWLGDGFAIVQGWVAGSDLAASLVDEPERWRDTREGLSFVRSLIETIDALHARGLAHGDLKPGNVIVARENAGPRPVLVDLLDFVAEADGEITSSAYAPLAGGRPERDRFAVGLIAEEILDACAASPVDVLAVRSAVAFCRDQPPGNASLAPLAAAVDEVLEPSTQVKPVAISLSIRDARLGELLPDEGKIYVRRPDPWSFFLRGASEEIQVWFNHEGKPRDARRRDIEQRDIARRSRHEFMSIQATLTVSRADVTDLSGLSVVLEDPEFASRHVFPHGAPNAIGSADETSMAEAEVLATAEVEGDDAEDLLAVEVAAEGASTDRTDVPLLWRTLVDVEGELTTEGVALGNSSYRREIGRHVVPFELSKGTFDFNRADTVGVERLDRNGTWRRLGDLDIARSSPDRVCVEVDEATGQRRRELVAENDRLRFNSHFGVQSLKRREGATSRILARESRVRSLIDLFDPRVDAMPLTHDRAVGDLSGYGLNDAQVSALRTIVQTRPLGLVQGPPGTGKTKFIAALAHHALTNGLAANVLLASQSHEAVNNAAEAVLRLFAASDDQPNLLRVGNEAVVSDRLLPFHTEKVETLFKDKFAAELGERLRIAGRSLGIPDDLTEAVSLLEGVIAPIAARMQAINEDGDADAARINGLRATLEAQVARLGLDADGIDLASGVATLTDTLSARLAARTWGGARISPDRIARLRTVAGIGRDFVSSVSTPQRNFETFLAGTRQIVAGTCVGLGRPSLSLTTTPFDLVIVDEAARCTAGELAVPMQAGRWVVLVGDQAQLPPQHDREVVLQVAKATGVARREVLRSDFERAFSTPYGTACGRRLVTQYRMLPPIGRLVSSTFYGGRLEHGRTSPIVDPACLPDDLASALSWVATDDLGEAGYQRREPGETSIRNPAEANVTMALLERWANHAPFHDWVVGGSEHAHAIGVICMYAAQRDLLRRKMQASSLPDAFRAAIKIDTVDSYQGKENPIVVLSLVRNNADGPLEGGAATIDAGFLYRPNRVNVAVSRAMDRLVVVGARRRWPVRGPMNRLAANFGHEADAGHAAFLAASGLSSEESSPPKQGRGRRERKP